MTPHEDAWLAGIAGHPVFRVDTGRATSRPALEALGDHIAGQRRAMYYVKVPTTEIGTVRGFGALGFSVVDVNVTFAMSTDRAALASDPPAGVEIADVRVDQHDDVLRIAGSCFRFDRFHLDPDISDATADRIKREWIANYLRKARGEHLLVASLDGRVSGFLAVLAGEVDGRATRVIDLVGVDTTRQRRGLGRALVADFVDRYRRECDELRVGTQAANVPSLALYEQMGFTISRTDYVLHLHIGDGQTGHDA